MEPVRVKDILHLFAEEEGDEGVTFAADEGALIVTTPHATFRFDGNATVDHIFRWMCACADRSQEQSITLL